MASNGDGGHRGPAPPMAMNVFIKADVRPTQKSKATIGIRSRLYIIKEVRMGREASEMYPKYIKLPTI